MSWVTDKTSEFVYYTWTRQAGVKPIEIAGGEGSWFVDTAGKRYLDFSSQVFNANLGHQHPRIIEAVTRQASTLALAGPKMAYEAKALLGEKLAQIAPGDVRKTFFCLGGAEAVENAVKMARAVTGRFKVVTRYRSYHGATMGALAMTGDPRRLPFEPLSPGVVRVHDPYCYRCPFGQKRTSCHSECASTIEETVMLEGPDQIAAILLEGLTGANGVQVPPDDYWKRIRALCDRHGILLISDEVFSGLGRTGKWFAVEHGGVVPDMITIAKGLGAGYVPIGAVLTNDRIARHFDEHPLVGGLTSYAPPICVGTALEVLRTYEDEGLVEHAARLGEHLGQQLQSLQARLPVVGDTRGRGLLQVIELSIPGTTQPLVPFNASAAESRVLAPLEQVFSQRGLYITVKGHYIILAPPLNSSQADLDLGLDIIKEGLEALQSSLSSS